VKIPGHPLDRKARPALVVSVDVRNQWAQDVIVVPLSTTLRHAPTHVLIPRGEAGLHHDSMAKCEQVTTLDNTLLLRGPFAGTVTAQTLMAVEHGIMRSIGVVV